MQVSNTFVVGERVFTPDGLRAALAARFNVPCDLPSASAPAEEAAAGRVWVSDGNVGQVMHTLHSSRSPAAAGSAFASVRFRLDFLPNPSRTCSASLRSPIFAITHTQLLSSAVGLHTSVQYSTSIFLGKYTECPTKAEEILRVGRGV